MNDPLAPLQPVLADCIENTEEIIWLISLISYD